MAGLVVLERHLWLTLMEIKDADKVSFLDAPISPSGLFGPAVKGFAERFTEAQKASQVMRHFLPSAPAQQLLRVALRLRRLSSREACTCHFRPSVCQDSADARRSRSARHHPFPKRQGPRPKIALDPAPPASS